jgi:hypothetical protein
MRPFEEIVDDTIESPDTGDWFVRREGQISMNSNGCFARGFQQMLAASRALASQSAMEDSSMLRRADAVESAGQSARS